MQHARGIRILRAPKERGGDVAPRRNIRITESATKESREDKTKREEGDTRNKRETTGRKDTTNEKGTRKGKGGTQRTAKNCRWLKSTWFQCGGLDFIVGIFLDMKPSVRSTQRHQQYPQCPSWFFIVERYKFCGHTVRQRKKSHQTVRSFSPTTSSAVPPVSFLILHRREIQILWSKTVKQRKT